MDNKSLEKIIRVNEIENNLILNVPDYIGEKIHKIITEQKLEEKNNYNIEIIENPKNVSLFYLNYDILIKK